MTTSSNERDVFVFPVVPDDFLTLEGAEVGPGSGNSCDTRRQRERETETEKDGGREEGRWRSSQRQRLGWSDDKQNRRGNDDR